MKIITMVTTFWHIYIPTNYVWRGYIGVTLWSVAHFPCPEHYLKTSYNGKAKEEEVQCAWTITNLSNYRVIALSYGFLKIDKPCPLRLKAAV